MKIDRAGYPFIAGALVPAAVAAVARRLYERFGFVVAGVRRGYYANPPEDALVLWREDLRHG